MYFTLTFKFLDLHSILKLFIYSFVFLIYTVIYIYKYKAYVLFFSQIGNTCLLLF